MGCISDKKTKGLMIALVVILLALALLSCMAGHYSLSAPEIFEAVRMKLAGEPVEKNIDTVLFSVRFPRILAAVLIGGGLSTAGATYQGVFRNPMVSPDLLGASSSASFGAVIAIMMGMGGYQIQLSAFVFGLAGVLISWFISTAVGNKHGDTLTLVLTGLVVSSLFQAFVSISKFIADPMDKLPKITFWLMGGLASISAGDLPKLLIPLLAGIIPLFLLRWRINALSLGDDEARTMGMDVGKVRFVVIICSTLVTSACVSISGIIGWVGLIIPHLVRMMVGPNYKHAIPVSLLVGAIFLVAVDNFSRAMFPSEVPLGVLTSIIGAPFFLFLLLRERRKEE